MSFWRVPTKVLLNTIHVFLITVVSFIKKSASFWKEYLRGYSWAQLTSFWSPVAWLTSVVFKRIYEGTLEHIGWRRLIGSPKLQIIFHKRATKYRALLRKMTYKDKGSFESSPLCSPPTRILLSTMQAKTRIFLESRLLYRCVLQCVKMSRVHTDGIACLLQRVAVCCSVLQCTISISLLAKRLVCVYATGQLLYCSVLQCVAGCCSVLQWVDFERAVFWVRHWVIYIYIYIHIYVYICKYM